MAGRPVTIPPPLRLSLPAEPGSVTRARHAAGDYAQSLGANRADVEALVSEAVANAVIHAFRGREPGTVTVSMQLAFSGRLLVTVDDDGAGMSPSSSHSGLGFGLALMAAVASSLEIGRRPGGGTRVTAKFEIS